MAKRGAKAGRSRRALDPQTVAGRERKAAAKHLEAVTIQTGLPAAQRGAEGLALIQVPQIGVAPRAADQTVRKLTKVELLRKRGVIEAHEATACEWYADTAALAWDTTGCTANYEGSSGGGGAHAPDRLMAKSQAIQHARDDYRMVGEGVPPAYLKIFEAVVCRNQGVGLTASDMFEGLARSRAEEKVRTTIRFVANIICTRMPAHLRLESLEAVTPSKRAVAAVVAPPSAKAEAQRVADLIDAQLEREASAGTEPAEIWLARATSDQLVVELGGSAGEVGAYQGLPVVIQEHWRFGWVIVPAERMRAAA